MYAPRAKFEQIHVISPIKVAVIFFTSLHCLLLFIAFLTSFWIRTQDGHYGPMISCERPMALKKILMLSADDECHFHGFNHDITILSIPSTALLISLSFCLAFISIVTASSSCIKSSPSMRRRYWLCTIILLFLVCATDWCIVFLIPLSYRGQVFDFQWAYGVHCGATILISGSFLAAILIHNADDVQYIESVDESFNKK